MDLMDLFRPNNGFKRAPLRPKKPNYAPSESSAVSVISSTYIRPVETGTDYVKKYVDEENKKVLEAARDSTKNDNKMDEMSVGTVPTQAGTEVDNEELKKFYSTFNFEHRPKGSLSIMQNKEEIVNSIRNEAVTIIEGVTGCGKSTQVPQFILDDCHNRREHCNIIVTQPRRIAALSIADRVSKERNWPLGSLVGVQVGLYKSVSKDTRLTYCTTGVLLRKLINAKNMFEFTHVVVDEVHERDQEMDFLLLIIRKLQRTNSRMVKVILMSATINATKFSQYFALPTETKFIAAPIISIAKQSTYKVEKHYLCQLETLGSLPEIVATNPRVSDKMMVFCMRLVDIFDDIDQRTEYDEDDPEIDDDEKPRHATLIFLPGIWEIEEMHNHMVRDAQTSKWDIVILHSSITHEEQKKIFNPPPKGYRRIILSTNIAESSITIDDVKYVIDFCLTKQLTTDPATNFQCLELTWASKANCEQRAGRSGRVMDGRAYRLIPKSFYDKLPSESDPEIVRAPLENVVLQTKLLDMGEPRAILALAIDPPDLRNLERTILLLKEAGGLIDKPDTFNRFDGILTDLGKIMAALPIDIHIAKLIALGHVFNVLRESIIMGASMSLKSMFSNPFLKRMEAYSAKVHWADGSTSDSLAFYSAYHVWQREIVANRFKRKSPQEASWAKRNYIQIKVMHEVDFLVSELTRRLEHLGIKETVGPKKIVFDDVDRALILKIILAGAFYPNYFVRNQSLAVAADKTHGTRASGGLDPFRTVFLQGWKPDQPGLLYVKRIQEIFKDVVQESITKQPPLVEFDGSMRVYIMFNDDKQREGNERQQADIPGRASLSVYRALKLRKMGNEIQIPVLDPKSARQRAKELKIPMNASAMLFNEDNYKTMKRMLPKTLPLLPGLDVSSISLKVAYIVNPSQFWVRNDDIDTKRKLKCIYEFLNDPKNITLTAFQGEASIGTLAAIRSPKDEKIYRVVIESLEVANKIASVLYIDYGYRGKTPVKHMMTIKPDHEVAKMRALAFECRLSEVDYCRKKDSRGWSKEAKQVFIELVEQSKELCGTIYSVVDSIVSLQLICPNKNDPDNSLIINERLVQLGLAEHVEESYLSKYNVMLREQILKYDSKHREYLEFLQYDKNFLIRTYPEPPSLKECGHMTITLKGPNSPLEISLSSLAVVASATKVSIEGNSVNSILLDSDPEDPHERLLVASLVSQNQNGTQLTLRNTTLMPNIRGLTALICMIFAPKIELRRSYGGNHYIGALCGLGCDSHGYSLLPEHDMEVYFDTEISMEDLQSINRLRHWMNMAICVQTDDIDDLFEQAIYCQRKVYELLNNLIFRQTKSQVPVKIPNFNKWRLYDDHFFLAPSRNVIKEDSIYPLHCALQIEKIDELAEEMKAHARELRLLAVSDSKLTRTEENMTIRCKMCNEDCFGREDLRHHLYKSSHREVERKYGFKI